MTTASVGPAVRVAALDARSRLLEAAAALLATRDSAPTPDELNVHESVISVRGTDRTITFADVGEKLGDVMIIGQGSRGPNPDGTAICAFGHNSPRSKSTRDRDRARAPRCSAHGSA